jgi:hypothetical protein
MMDASHSIELRRGEQGAADSLVYRDAEGRSVEFACRAADAPVSVWIPRERWWLERTPAWAHAQRDEIVERVRAWGAIVHEPEPTADWGSITTIQSPDRAFRIECSVRQDDRCAPWERTRMLANAGDEVLVDLPLHRVEALAFSGAGSVTLNLAGRYGDRRRVRVDVARRRFHLDADPDGAGHPLALLATMLATMLAPVPAAPAPLVPRRRQVWFESALGLLAVPFALGGLWLAIAAKTLSDRLAGIAGVVIGGLAAASAIADLRRRRAAAPPQQTRHTPR